MAIVIRAARREDLPSIYRLLDVAFGDAPVELFINQTEGDSTMRLRHIRVAEVDGEIAAHVRIFSRRMLIRGVPVRAGGIGSVASAPAARGLGLPSALLNDCIDLMMRERTAVSFLYTGIPAFYERLGWRIVRQPILVARADEAAAIAQAGAYRIHQLAEEDLPSVLAIYRRSIAVTTGAIARTERTWRDAQSWLDEDRAGCLVAECAGRPVAYLRARSRNDGYNVFEAEHLREHEAALARLFARAGRRALTLGTHSLTSYAPADSTLAKALRTLPSTQETEDARYPAMMRIVSLDALIAALLPRLDERASTHRGSPFSLALCAPDGQAAMLDIGAARVRLRRRPAQYALDEASTLDALLGQRRASALVRPRPPAEIRHRIDALLPEAAFHFWNSDRI
jgi:predicted N-acetyltransferase YhbS